jgi:hypothetical protein
MANVIGESDTKGAGTTIYSRNISYFLILQIDDGYLSSILESNIGGATVCRP